MTDTEPTELDEILSKIEIWGGGEHGDTEISPESLTQATQLINKSYISRKAVERLLSQKKVLEVEEPHLYQGVGGDSAPFYCSACQMGEMSIMDNKEGDKYFCSCSYWTDPHNAYIDRSGGKWLGWKDKSKAQEYLDSLPTEENGWNACLAEIRERLKIPEIETAEAQLLQLLESKKAYHKCKEGWFEYVPLDTINEIKE